MKFRVTMEVEVEGWMFKQDTGKRVTAQGVEKMVKLDLECSGSSPLKVTAIFCEKLKPIPPALLKLAKKYRKLAEEKRGSR